MVRTHGSTAKVLLTLALCASCAGAATTNFIVSGTLTDGAVLGGTITVDTIAGTVTAANLQLSAPDSGTFNVVAYSFAFSGAIWELVVYPPPGAPGNGGCGGNPPDYSDGCVWPKLFLFMPTGTLVGYLGGPLCSFPSPSSSCFDSTLGGTLSSSLDPPAGGGGGANIDLQSGSVSCPVNVVLFPLAQYMQATFTPLSGDTLKQYATACGYDHFNWQQEITTLPSPSPFYPRVPGDILNPQNLACNTCPLTANPANPLYDPPPGSYTYEPASYDPYPFYYPSSFVETSGICTIPLGGTLCSFPYIVSSDGTTLSFVDDPADPYLFGGFVAFSTSLVGVDNQGNAHGLYSWTWKSTFDGTTGGVSQTASINPVDPGSGTGGVTIATINGVPVSPCDINYDGVANVVDVQLIINEALGVTPAVNDLNGDGVVNVVDVQIVINAALGLGCVA